MQNTSSEHTSCRTLKMAYSTRRPHRCHSCQLRTRKWDYYCAGTNVDQKNFPWVRVLNVSCEIQMFWPEFGVNSMKIFPTPFLANFGPLSTNWATVWGYHVNMEQNLEASFATLESLLISCSPCWPRSQKSVAEGNGNKWLIIFFLFFLNAKGSN